jgi:uncharacterized protein (DUF58 family)
MPYTLPDVLNSMLLLDLHLEYHNSLLPVTKSKRLAESLAFLLAFGGLVFSVLAIGHKIRGFKPSRGRRIFKSGKKCAARLPSEGNKAVGPMS